jgi:type I restriction enzyme M protein
MASPLTVARNNYHKNPKDNAIYTPPGVARFLFDILHEAKPFAGRNLADLIILDPAIGKGNLVAPWFDAGCHIVGCDVTNIGLLCHRYYQGRFEDQTDLPRPDLVCTNPPFNGAPGKQLYPEVFLRHIFHLWGPKMPTVMFVPMGLRLNQRCKSTRFRWLRDCGTRITSIVSLPLDIFPGVEFHAEILIFNVDGIQPHYFLPEEALR